LLFGALAWRFFQPQIVGRKRFFSNTTPKSWRPDWLIGPEFTPAKERIQTFLLKTCGLITPTRPRFVA
jgi:hypothetical protein